MKEKILAHALKTFNQEGPQKASLRHLARQMEISDGHLRYYFRTKNLLILALLDEFEAAAETAESQSIETMTESFNGFLQVLLPHFELRSRYRFLVLDSHHLSEAIPEFRTKCETFLENRRVFMGELLSRLQFAGIIDNKLPQWRFDLILDQMHHLSFAFLRKLSPESSSGSLISQGIQMSAGLLLPHIQEKDRKMATVQLLAV